MWGVTWETYERVKERTGVAKDLFLDSEPACDEGRGFALHCALKHGSTANLEERELSNFHAVMEHGHGVMWRFRKPGNTTAVFVFFALVFSLYSLNNCRVRAFLDSLLF